MPAHFQSIKRAYNDVLPQNNAELQLARGHSYPHLGANEDSHLARLAALLDIPNWRPSHGYGKQSWGNLGKKFVGWQDNVSTGKKVRNVFLAIFFFVPVNLITVLVRTPINILRLATEFLPTMISNAIRAKLFSFWSRNEEKGVAKTLQIIGLRLVQALMFLLILASRSVTNPVQSVRMAWITGRRNPVVGHHVHPLLGIVAGLLLSAMSITFTLVGYTLLAGIPAIQAGSAAVANFIFGNITQVMPVLSSLVSALSTYGMGVGKMVSGMLAFIPAASQFVAASTATMPALLGVAGLAATLIPVVGGFITAAVETFKSRWYKSSVSKDISEDMFDLGDDGAPVMGTYTAIRVKGGFDFSRSKATAPRSEPMPLPPVIVVQHPTQSVPESAPELNTSLGFRA